MKKKFTRILGVGLSLVLLVGLMSIATPATGSSHGMIYKLVEAPSEINDVLIAGDIDLMVTASDGTIFAWDSGVGLYRSTDAGVTWKAQAGVLASTTLGKNLPLAGVVALATSPNYATDTTVVAAVGTAGAGTVWRSTNGGVSFGDAVSTVLDTAATADVAATYSITSIDVAPYFGSTAMGILVGVNDTAAASFQGATYLFKSDVFTWTLQGAAFAADDVLAVAFSPNHSADAQIVAVTATAAATNVRTKFSSNAWAANIPDVAIANAATSAVIAFPASGYEWWTANQYLVGTAGGAADDVYLIKSVLGAAPTATDKNAGGAATETEVHSVSIQGAIASEVLVGQKASTDIRHSPDITQTTATALAWKSSTKDPTGATGTVVAWSPTETGRAFAGTIGVDSAISRTTGSWKYWNQVGLIDTGVVANVTLLDSAVVDENTIFLTISNPAAGYAQSLYRTTNGGTSWERILSSTGLDIVAPSPGYATDTTVYVDDNTRLWKSSDGGDLFTAVTIPLALTALTVVDKDTYFTGHLAALYKGGKWAAATGLQAAASVTSIVASPNYATDTTLAIGNSDGDVYISTNDGGKFTRVGADDSLGNGATVNVVLDADFANNSTIYAGSSTNTVGVYRTTGTATTSTWKQIDDDTNTLAVIGMAQGADGTLYAASSAAGAGIRRSLDPKTAISTTLGTAPTFESMDDTTATTFKLTAAAVLGDLAVLPGGNTLYAIDSVNVAKSTAPLYGYTGRLLVLEDSLTAAQVLTSPSTSGVSRNVPFDSHISTVTTATLAWDKLVGATNHDVWYSTADSFSTTATGVTTVKTTKTTGTIDLAGLTGGKKYYWKIRAIAPVRGPWSATWSFSTSLAAVAATTVAVAPKQGSTGSVLVPTFTWPAVTGATSYEIEVSESSDFSILEFSATAGTNAFVSKETLRYSTAYYWRVRAVSALAVAAATERHGSKWTTFTFTTMAKPVPAPEPLPAVEILPTPPTDVQIRVVEVEVPGPTQTVTVPSPPQVITIEKQVPIAQAVPSYLLWTIIGVGAVLIIALIVLIVRTRRVS